MVRQLIAFRLRRCLDLFCWREGRQQGVDQRAGTLELQFDICAVEEVIERFLRSDQSRDSLRLGAAVRATLERRKRLRWEVTIPIRHSC